MWRAWARADLASASCISLLVRRGIFLVPRPELVPVPVRGVLVVGVRPYLGHRFAPEPVAHLMSWSSFASHR